MNYKHIIITRFNLEYEDELKALQTEWLEKRFELFERYCLPSIQQQTCQNFTWVILASDNTPTQYKKRLIKHQTDNIHIVFCPKCKDEDKNLLYQEIGKQYLNNHSFLISTRLDNDDMLHARFVEKIHSYLNSNKLEPTIIVFPKGVQWFVEECQAFAIKWKLSHFHTFVERADNIHTSLGMDHRQIPQSRITVLWDKDMWCEVVHGTNLANDYEPRFHYYLHHQHGEYPVPLPNKSYSQKLMFLFRKHMKLRAVQVKKLMKKLLNHAKSVL